MIRQIERQVPVEHVDNFHRNRHARPPRRHREGKALPRHRDLGPRRRLYLAELERAKAVLEAVEQFAHVQSALDVRFAHGHHMPIALGDFERGLGPSARRPLRRGVPLSRAQYAPSGRAVWSCARDTPEERPGYTAVTSPATSPKCVAPWASVIATLASRLMA